MSAHSGATAPAVQWTQANNGVSEPVDQACSAGWTTPRLCPALVKFNLLEPPGDTFFPPSTAMGGHRAPLGETPGDTPSDWSQCAELGLGQGQTHAGKGTGNASLPFRSGGPKPLMGTLLPFRSSGPKSPTAVFQNLLFNGGKPTTEFQNLLNRLAVLDVHSRHVHSPP